MDKEEILRILHECEVILTNDHFVLKSGRHALSYFNKDALYKHPRKAQPLYQVIADRFWGKDVEVIAAPAIGGVALEQNVGRLIYPYEHQREPITIFAEDGPADSKIFKRGYAKEIPDKRVLVLEDVLTTGGSVLAVIREVQRLGGKVIGLGVLCDRREMVLDKIDGIKVFALITSSDLSRIDWSTFNEEDCPLCKKGIPINTDVGKGREYLAKKAR